MEENWKERTEILIGEDNIRILKNSKVAVFGIGGVGSFAVEALARAGIGHLVLIDNDIISVTNLNRQIHATIDTIGKSKVEVMKDRILSINPNVIVEVYTPDDIDNGNEENIIDDTFSYIIDSVDTIKTKLNLIEKANSCNVPIISAMGAGNKLEPTMFEVADIYNTSVCPLAKVMRKELKKRNIPKLKVVYSKEEPKKSFENIGSIAFVPSVVGLIMASEVIKDIIGE